MIHELHFVLTGFPITAIPNALVNSTSKPLSEDLFCPSNMHAISLSAKLSSNKPARMASSLSPVLSAPTASLVTDAEALLVRQPMQNVIGRRINKFQGITERLANDMFFP